MMETSLHHSYYGHAVKSHDLAIQPHQPKIISRQKSGQCPFSKPYPDMRNDTFSWDSCNVDFIHFLFSFFLFSLQNNFLLLSNLCTSPLF